MEVCSSVTRVVALKKGGEGGSRKDGATSGSMKELQGIIKGWRGGEDVAEEEEEEEEGVVWEIGKTKWRNAVKAAGCCLEFIAYPFRHCSIILRSFIPVCSQPRVHLLSLILNGIYTSLYGNLCDIIKKFIVCIRCCSIVFLILLLTCCFEKKGRFTLLFFTKGFWKKDFEKCCLFHSDSFLLRKVGERNEFFYIERNRICCVLILYYLVYLHLNIENFSKGIELLLGDWKYHLLIFQFEDINRIFQIIDCPAFEQMKLDSNDTQAKIRTSKFTITYWKFKLPISWIFPFILTI